MVMRARPDSRNSRWLAVGAGLSEVRGSAILGIDLSKSQDGCGMTRECCGRSHMLVPSL